MSDKAKTWCERAEHSRFEYFVDSNDWLDSGADEATAFLNANKRAGDMRQND